MVEISEIVDEASLKAWLLEQPDPDAASVAVSHRVVMRVLPVAWQWFADQLRESDATAIPILRASLTSGVIHNQATDNTMDAAIACRAPVVRARNIAETRATAGVSAPSTNYVAAASYAAERAVAAAAAPRVAASLSESSYAAAHAANSVNAAKIAADIDAHGVDMWHVVRRDCGALAANDDLSTAHLWPADGNPLAAHWRDLRAKLSRAPGSEATAQGETSPDWSFWINWYEHALNGTETRWKMLEEIATQIEDEAWKGDTSILMAEINAIWRNHEPSKPDDLFARMERGAKPSPQIIQHVRKTASRNRAELPATFDALEGLILLEIERLQKDNYLNVEQPDETKRQIANYLTMFDAVRALRQTVPVERDLSEEEAEKSVRVLAAYAEAFKELPLKKKDEVVEGVWSTGKGIVQVGLVATSTLTFSYFGLPVALGAGLGAVVFAPKHSGELIKAAREAVWPTAK